MLSLFSAPNYCDSYDNKGAILALRGGQMSFKQFFSSPHPYVLPNFINGLEWSFPFVAEKLVEILHVLLSLDDDEEDESDASDRAESVSSHTEQLGPKAKVALLGRISREVRK
jgi:serine/threonine-protein phosphatase 2B catalytic subunit